MTKTTVLESLNSPKLSDKETLRNMGSKIHTYITSLVQDVELKISPNLSG